jgi:hypothetical protein
MGSKSTTADRTFSIIYILVGLLAGACLSILVAEGALIWRMRNLSPLTVLVTPTSTSLPPLPSDTPVSPSLTPSPIATATYARLTTTSTSEPLKALLEQARGLIEQGNFEQVKPLLLPELSSFTLPSDLARANEYLGQAEIEMGHFELATGYFTKLYYYEPTPEHLWMLANAQSIAGNIKDALASYEILAKWDDPRANVYRSMAEEEVRFMQKLLGTPVPTLTSTPASL